MSLTSFLLVEGAAIVFRLERDPALFAGLWSSCSAAQAARASETAPRVRVGLMLIGLAIIIDMARPSNREMSGSKPALGKNSAASGSAEIFLRCLAGMTEEVIPPQTAQ